MAPGVSAGATEHADVLKAAEAAAQQLRDIMPRLFESSIFG